MLEYNIKEDMPTVNEAIDRLEQIVALNRNNTKQIICIIHGYGSHGGGGKIGKAVRKWVVEQKENHYIKNYVFGEKFEMFDEVSRHFHIKDKETDEYYGRLNPGITLIEV